MNYAEIRKLDVTNGPGVRTTLFVSGCTNNCEGCFNKDLQNFTYGKRWSAEIADEFIGYINNTNVKGVNILGGEPMEQTGDRDLINLLDRIKKETGKNIWLWSGFLYEDIIRNELMKEILSYVDILIDGKFELANRNISLKYRGSSNQRVIDVKESIKRNGIITVDC